MRLLLVTDAWHPQVNGVVRTIERVAAECEALGHEVEICSPDQFASVPCPIYPEIQLALRPGGAIGRLLDRDPPDCVHIATEGPLGLAARRHCLRRGIAFTTSYHTRFPEYLATRLPLLPLAWGYAWMRWFHRPAAGLMVATESLRRELESRGFSRIKAWSRGVDTDLFRPGRRPALELPRPVFLYVGRVAIEKNLEAFLAMPIAGGTRLVVGDGPQRARLERRWPEARFVGAKVGEDLAAHYAAADVLVFPSLTDTFGLVLLEALAAGLPVAAYPVPGPLDVLGSSACGVLDLDLAAAAQRALLIPRERCRRLALGFSWRSCAEQFLANLCRTDGRSAQARPLRAASGGGPRSPG
jgi:glycosyltransferase involved in cell wall biosynthesis